MHNTLLDSNAQGSEEFTRHASKFMFLHRAGTQQATLNSDPKALNFDSGTPQARQTSSMIGMAPASALPLGSFKAVDTEAISGVWGLGFRF